MKHERRLTLIWLAGSGLLLAVLAVWGVGLGGAERSVEALEGRWEAKLEKAERLYEAGAFEPAAALLERIDRDHPAEFVKHRLDRQRERVLELLARSQLALDKKSRALSAAERAADFDPLNWNNHHLVAEVAEHFGEGGLADEARTRVLELYPSHLPSVTGRITAAFEGGRYAEVPPLFEAYLDAWRVAELTVEVAGRTASLTPLIDGRPHRVGGVFAESTDDVGAPEGPPQVLVHTGGYAVDLGKLLLAPTSGPAREVATEDWSPLTPAAGDRAGEGATIATWTAPAPLETPARVTAEVTVYKALPAELWTMVETSYRNTLAHDRLAAIEPRILVGAPDAPLQLVD